MKELSWKKYSFGALAAFSACAVVSIGLQNLVWVSVLFWLTALAKKQTTARWPKGPFATATLLFLLTFFTGALFGVNPGESFHTVHKYLTFLLFFLVGAMAIEKPKINKLILLFPRGAALCGAWAIYKHFFLHEDRAMSFYGFYMVFAGLLMAALILQLFFVFKNPRDIPGWAVGGILAFALLFTQTRGAWVGLVAGISFWLLFQKPKGLLFLALILLGVFFTLPTKYQDRVKAVWNFGMVYDNQERIYMWRSGWAISKDYPWFGVGQENLSKVYPKYRNPQAQDLDIPHLHNNFVQILVQNGWLGFAAYLFWIGAYYLQVFKRKILDPDFREWNWGFASIFTASLVWGLTEYTFSHQFMNVQFFFLGLQAHFWGDGSRDENPLSYGSAARPRPKGKK